MDEHQLRVMFEDFGPVFQINVLRDKISGQSKGKKADTFYITIFFTYLDTQMSFLLIFCCYIVQFWTAYLGWFANQGKFFFFSICPTMIQQGWHILRALKRT